MRRTLRWIKLALIVTGVLAQKKVFEVTNTPEAYGGLYMETDKDYKFRKLGGPFSFGDGEGYHLFIFREQRASQRWYLGDRDKGEADYEIIKNFYAWSSSQTKDKPPKYGWKNMKYKTQK